MAPYADDIQSPDWVRSYPGGNAGDALAYRKKGFLFSEAAAAGLPVKIYGEYVEYDTLQTAERVDRRAELERFLRRLEELRGRAEKTLYYQNTIRQHASVPAVQLTSSRTSRSSI